MRQSWEHGFCRTLLRKPALISFGFSLCEAGVTRIRARHLAHSLPWNTVGSCLRHSTGSTVNRKKLSFSDDHIRVGAPNCKSTTFDTSRQLLKTLNTCWFYMIRTHDRARVGATNCKSITSDASRRLWNFSNRGRRTSWYCSGRGL